MFQRMHMADPLMKVMIEPGAAQGYVLRLNRFHRLERDGEISGILDVMRLARVGRGGSHRTAIFRRSVMSRALTLGHPILIRA